MNAILSHEIGMRNVDIVRTLLQGGADPNAIVNGSTPLDCIQNPSMLRPAYLENEDDVREIRELLIQYGASKTMHEEPVMKLLDASELPWTY